MTPQSPTEEVFRLQDQQKKALKKLGIQTVRDLLHHFPTRYGDTSEIKNINSLVAGESAVIFGKISGLKASKAFRTKITMAEGRITDDTGTIKALWFNQPYIAKMIGDESLVRVEGKISRRRKTDELYFSNPKIEKVEKLPTGVGDSLFGKNGETHSLYPVYPESRGVTSNWFFHAIQKVLVSGALEFVEDPIPKIVLEKYHLPTLKTALIWIHAPKNENDALSARKRFAFEEVFYIQLERQKERLLLKEQPTHFIQITPDKIKQFLSRFPFSPTSAQRKAIDVILQDLKEGVAMSRLLEGDVGSGKTLVAAATAYGVIETPPKDNKFGRLQVAYMAPTEILARQHFESFIQFFKHLPVNIALITGTECLKFPSKINPNSSTHISRNQLLKWVKGGEISILVGTHALIQKSVEFKHLGYVVIDEQHRFGVNQRKALVRKHKTIPHLLSMTATPIPRTLALTIFGDLDLTLLDEMPAGRKLIITEVVLPGKRDDVYEKARAELAAGRQAYVICPRIDEPDPSKEMALNVKSAKEEAKRLKESVFPEYEIAVMHGKLKSGDKDTIMADFKTGKIHILVSTSVVEVGVNVPNATVIIVEGAERFGLAQLHQLRGRVLRSTHQAFCYIFADVKSQKTLDRLSALTKAKNGFELAEYDLQFRGAGELGGRKQWGITDIAMEAIKNIKMVEAARAEARALLESDPTLSSFPILQSKLSTKKEIHFE